MKELNHSDEYKKSLKQLRAFFTLSVAAFEFQDKIMESIGHKTYITPLRQLHILAKEEVFKETPNLEYVDYILKQLELITKSK